MHLQRQIDQLLALRASEWHQILESASEEERAAFVQWLKQSQLHVQEYLETVYTDRLLDHIDSARAEDVDALLARLSSKVEPLANASAPANIQSKPRRLRRWQIGWALAAALALVAVV